MMAMARNCYATTRMLHQIIGYRWSKKGKKNGKKTCTFICFMLLQCYWNCFSHCEVVMAYIGKFMLTNEEWYEYDITYSIN